MYLKNEIGIFSTDTKLWAQLVFEESGRILRFKLEVLKGAQSRVWWITVGNESSSSGETLPAHLVALPLEF